MNAIVFETPLGFMGAVSQINGISHVFLPKKSEKQILAQLKKVCGQEWETNPQLRRLQSDMLRYIKGRYIDFSVYPVEYTPSTSFQKLVWSKVKDIGYGKKMTYKELAHEIKRPNSIRAIGGALNKNRVPILIPCHRVISESGLGGYSGGVPLKKKLLQIERII